MKLSLFDNVSDDVAGSTNFRKPLYNANASNAMQCLNKNKMDHVEQGINVMKLIATRNSALKHEEAAVTTNYFNMVSGGGKFSKFYDKSKEF